MAIFSWFVGLNFIVLRSFESKVSSCVCYRGFARLQPRTLDESLSLACELEAFRLVDGDERRSSLQVRSVDEADKEPDLFQAQLDMLRSDIRVQQQRQ